MTNPTPTNPYISNKINLDSEMESGLPGPETIARFHDNDDVDGSAFAHHHTLGSRPTQAAPGNHRHNGADSAALFDDFLDPNNEVNPYTGATLAPYERGVSVPVGMKNHKRLGETFTSISDNTIFGSSNAIRVVGGHSYLVRFSFEGQGNADNQTVRLNLKVKENPHVIPPEGTAVAPPPLVLGVPTTTDPSVENSSYVGVESGPRTNDIWRVYVPEKNGVARFGMWWRYGSGLTSLQARNITFTVIDLGREEADNWRNLWYMMSRLLKVLRKMGGTHYVLGENDTYHT